MEPKHRKVPHDGNSAVAHVAHATSEVIAIYPITPASPMGEEADEKSARGEKNIWGFVPYVTELQSEAGAAGVVHGALAAGSLTTTFTASQGLLLMIPNMYKIAGELLPCVFHVAARSLATHALSIFGDHSDVCATRATGFALLSSNSVQEAMDFALISLAASLESRIPYLHFFDGFRVSHEIQKIEELTFDDMRAMLDQKYIDAFKAHAMSPDHPDIRGTSQNPDVYFQGRERVNPYYEACPQILHGVMNKFGKRIGRHYSLYEYFGNPKADRIIITMGSSVEVIREVIRQEEKKGEKLGVLAVRLFRPFSRKHFLEALPATVKSIAVLDRTKEPGSLGEPLYEDVVTSIAEGLLHGSTPFSKMPNIIGGRYGLGSKEFTPAMVKRIYDELEADDPKHRFTIGISDDLTHTSLDYNDAYTIRDSHNPVYEALFYGLGSDGTVGANKNTIKIIAGKTDRYAQGYFVYDSKKSGALTVSHLRFAKDPIQKPYLITNADFLACHHFSFIEKYDILKNLKTGGIFLLNSPYNKDELWNHLPPLFQKTLIDKKVSFYSINAHKIAHEIGLGSRINTIMQVAFFKISKVLDEAKALNEIRNAIQKTYASKGEKIISMNLLAVDRSLESLEKITVPEKFDGRVCEKTGSLHGETSFIQNVTYKLLCQEGDDIAVSHFPDDGRYPLGTSKFEKRDLATNVPAWNPETCIQCGFCSYVCPHACVRIKAYDNEYLKDKPAAFKFAPARGGSLEGMQYTIQVAVEDCTGCELCVEVCPEKEKDALKMIEQKPIRDNEIQNFNFFLQLPELELYKFKSDTVKGSQFIQPLFEFSGACSGCGETPYIKLLTQLFGDRLLIANATGCSSIYGGNLPTTPYTTRNDGRGPAWNNSLFEDNAEFAYGMRLSCDSLYRSARMLAEQLVEKSPNENVRSLLRQILEWKQDSQLEIEHLRGKINVLNELLEQERQAEALSLRKLTDYLVKKSVWGVGGDGWAYDIGYGGLDHVLASGANINYLILDTESYSNTGGQASKATPLGAVARFAAHGKETSKKDMGLIFMTYGTIYVARIAFGANMAQTLKAFIEAEKFNGPSIIIAYAHCINHGIVMQKALEDQKKATLSWHWPLFRFNPDLEKAGKNPLIIDSKPPSISIEEYTREENRFGSLAKQDPGLSRTFLLAAQKDAERRYLIYSGLHEVYEKKVKK